MSENGRDNMGRFVGGHKHGGRPPGSQNRTTVDLRLIRDSIVGTWDQVDGNRRLVELAETDFPLYCKLVLPLLPRPSEVELTTRPLFEHSEYHTKRTVGFFADLERMTGGGPVTPELLLDAYKRDNIKQHKEDETDL